MDKNHFKNFLSCTNAKTNVKIMGSSNIVLENCMVEKIENCCFREGLVNF